MPETSKAAALLEIEVPTFKKKLVRIPPVCPQCGVDFTEGGDAYNLTMWELSNSTFDCNLVLGQGKKADVEVGPHEEYPSESEHHAIGFSCAKCKFFLA